MSIYHADRATPEVLGQVQRLLAPVCEALVGDLDRWPATDLPLHRLASDLLPAGWKFEMRREQVRPPGTESWIVAKQGWPVRVVCSLVRATGRHHTSVWTLPGWGLAGLVLLVADLGPEANWPVKASCWVNMGLWPALEAVTSTILAGGYAGRLP